MVAPIATESRLRVLYVSLDLSFAISKLYSASTDEQTESGFFCCFPFFLHAGDGHSRLSDRVQFKDAGISTQFLN